MISKNRALLAARVAKAAWTSLAVQGYVSPIGVLIGLGWLDTAIAPDALICHWHTT